MCYIALLGIGVLSGVQWFTADSCFLCNSKNTSDILSSSAAVVAVLATIYGYYQHKQDEKARMIAKYNERYRTDKVLNEVVEHLIGLQLKDEQEIQQVDSITDAKTTNQREMFLRFIEEVQYLVDKDLIDKDEAYDMFGYYANIAVKSGENFLNDLKDKGSYKSVNNENNWKTLYKFVDNYKQYKNHIK